MVQHPVMSVTGATLPLAPGAYSVSELLPWLATNRSAEAFTAMPVGLPPIPCWTRRWSRLGGTQVAPGRTGHRVAGEVRHEQVSRSI